MKKVNQLTICRDNFGSQEEFANGIRDAVMVLLNNDNIMTVRWDEKGLGILVIDYETDDEELGAPYPTWLTPTEWESIIWDDERNKQYER